MIRILSALAVVWNIVVHAANYAGEVQLPYLLPGFVLAIFVFLAMFVTLFKDTQILGRQIARKNPHELEEYRDEIEGSPPSFFGRTPNWMIFLNAVFILNFIFTMLVSASDPEQPKSDEVYWASSGAAAFALLAFSFFTFRRKMDND